MSLQALAIAFSANATFISAAPTNPAPPPPQTPPAYVAVLPRSTRQKKAPVFLPPETRTANL